MKKLAAEREVLRVDTGDALLPMELRHAPPEEHRADLIAHAFAQLGYAGLAVGERDLADGLQPLLARRDRDQLPYLAANLALEQGQHPFPASRVVQTRLGRIGIFAVTALDKPTAGLHAEDPAAAARIAAADLRAQKVDAVIALVHARLDQATAIVRGLDVDLALLGHEGRAGTFSTQPPAYGASQKGRELVQVELQLGPGQVHDGSAGRDAQAEVKILEQMEDTLKKRDSVATTEAAHQSFAQQLQKIRERHAEAQARASAPQTGRTAISTLLPLGTDVADDPELAKVVDAEIAADGHTPGH